MDEKIYKLVGRSGASALVLGICVLTGGIAAGILLIVSGAKLIGARSKILI